MVVSKIGILVLREDLACISSVRDTIGFKMRVFIRFFRFPENKGVCHLIYTTEVIGCLKTLRWSVSEGLFLIRKDPDMKRT